MIDKHQPWKSLLPDICFWVSVFFLSLFVIPLVTDVFYGAHLTRMLVEFTDKLFQRELFNCMLMLVAITASTFSFISSKSIIRKVISLFCAAIHIFYLMAIFSRGDFG